MTNRSAIGGCPMRELRRLCNVLDEQPNTRAANAVRLQLLTGARLGEVLSSRKEDFDLQRGVWTKLSAQALAMVTSIIETGDPCSSFLVPGNKPAQPLREIKKFWSNVLLRSGIAN
jgi:integrase